MKRELLAPEFAQVGRFDWQEKLLEKTIRTELQMQEYVKILEKAMDEIRVHKEEFEEMARNIAKTNEEIKLGIRTTTKQLTANVTNLQEHMYTRTITFSAKTAFNLIPETSQVIIFQTVLQNEGNAYDSTSGVFTSPVNGTFFFSVQLCANNRKWARFQLVVDNMKSILAISHYNRYASHTTTSNSVAQYLSEGQKVWVQASYNAGLSETPFCWNQFSGMLVHY